MKAIIIQTPGGAENLIHTEITVPAIQDGEVLVKVKAISINPIDAKTRSGKGMYGKLTGQDPIIIGWDISGEVTATKSDLFKVGDAVFGMVNFPGHGKAYAEYVAAPASQLALKPANISHTQAAATTLAALTAWQALITHGKIKTNDRVLIHSAAGGVGHFAVQIAKNAGAYVVGTSSAENKDFVLGLGADEHIDYKARNLKDATRDIDFVLDPLGGDNIDKSLQVMKKGGTIISLPTGLRELVGEKAEAAGMTGFFIMVTSNGKDMNSLASLLEKGIVKAHVSQEFGFDDMAKAHRQIESGKTRGKIVVTL
ncbi:2-haloacrylate reductase [Dyadobacter sp. CECT 9275]|uniref:2-haloacrylate reductase n=1 Tax=Dyadobacter helix TaxID=2822344 RepID=A0A916N6R5_9BACT|nr:NADP-dependent oxidoreductase [Dyadobacter sp. CECT 9275]CAG5004976.1 2-haloacrylate reductase [Dyadobacter sp. CECT 9275]